MGTGRRAVWDSWTWARAGRRGRPVCVCVGLADVGSSREVGTSGVSGGRQENEESPRGSGASGASVCPSLSPVPLHKTSVRHWRIWRGSPRVSHPSPVRTPVSTGTSDSHRRGPRGPSTGWTPPLDQERVPPSVHHRCSDPGRRNGWTPSSAHHPRPKSLGFRLINTGGLGTLEYGPETQPVWTRRMETSPGTGYHWHRRRPGHVFYPAAVGTSTEPRTGSRVPSDKTVTPLPPGRTVTDGGRTSADNNSSALQHAKVGTSPSPRHCGPDTSRVSRLCPRDDRTLY